MGNEIKTFFVGATAGLGGVVVQYGVSLLNVDVLSGLGVIGGVIATGAGLVLLYMIPGVKGMVG